MKTIKYLIFFGGFMMFFNFSRACASPINGSPSASVNHLREQIAHTFSHTFFGMMETTSEIVTVDFVVGPDNHLRVVEISGGTQILKKLVKEKFAEIEANSSLTNERYTIQLTINLI